MDDNRMYGIFTVMEKLGEQIYLRRFPFRQRGRKRFCWP